MVQLGSSGQRARLRQESTGAGNRSACHGRSRQREGPVGKRAGEWTHLAKEQLS